ncbi:MAG: lytic transglycosylase domain-containing protein [Chitinophagaceae bacterium]|nr:lytic transglycosylase domain-containing protein [Chitinophagaceae bacterium]
MKKFYVRGFGCLFFVICLVAFAQAETIKDNDTPPQTKDTTIKITAPAGIVVADAVNAPSAEEMILMAKSEEVAKASSAIKTISLREKMFKELHPASISFVKSYQQNNERRLEKIKLKYERQFKLIDNILEKYQLPTNLKYLAIIESELSNSALSNKGAVGPWQFMVTTGRLMGLTINGGRDERRDLTKSTHAAAKYLKSLYSQYNDWLLVIAAYNGGGSRVDNAIKKSGSRDFWKLQQYLPLESRNHVKKFIAAQFVLEASDELVPLFDIRNLSSDELANTEVLNITGKFKAAVIAKALGMDESTFNLYNPGFDRDVSTKGYSMRVPKDKVAVFNARREDLLYESVQTVIDNNKTIAAEEDKAKFPEAINLPKSKAIVTDRTKVGKRL